MDATPLWATFRSWPTWVQAIAWLLVWPVVIGVYTLTKPPGQRRGWWVATGAAGPAKDGAGVRARMCHPPGLSSG